MEKTIIIRATDKQYSLIISTETSHGTHRAVLARFAKRGFAMIALGAAAEAAIRSLMIDNLLYEGNADDLATLKGVGVVIA